MSLACRQAHDPDHDGQQTIACSGQSPHPQNFRSSGAWSRCATVSPMNRPSHDAITKQQTQVDHAIDRGFTEALAGSEIDPAIRDSTLLALDKLDQVRRHADDHPGHLDTNFDRYTTVINTLLDTATACVKAKTDRGIGKLFWHNHARAISTRIIRAGPRA